jgi:hypothetical protein
MNYKKITSLDEIKVNDRIRAATYESFKVLAKCEGAILVYNEEQRWLTLTDIIDLEYELEVKEERWKPEVGRDYFTSDPTMNDYSCMVTWNNSVSDHKLYGRGLIYKTPEEAQEAAKAMIAFNLNRNK